MKGKNYILFILLSVCFFVTSCNKEDEQLKQSKVALVETTSTQDVLSMLLIETDGDEDVLCRVLNCSKSTFERLHSGKTRPTENADKEIRHLLKLSYEEGANAIYDLDPTDRWFDSCKRAIDSCPIWLYIVGLIIIGALLGALLQDNGIIITIAIPFVILIFRFFIYYLCTWIWQKPELTDNFINSVNTVWEIL